MSSKEMAFKGSHLMFGKYFIFDAMVTGGGHLDVKVLNQAQGLFDSRN